MIYEIRFSNREKIISSDSVIIRDTNYFSKDRKNVVGNNSMNNRVSWKAYSSKLREQRLEFEVSTIVKSMDCPIAPADVF